MPFTLGERGLALPMDPCDEDGDCAAALIMRHVCSDPVCCELIFDEDEPSVPPPPPPEQINTKVPWNIL